MKKIHYSWFICGACTMMMFCTLGLIATSFSLYIPYIISFNGFSGTETYSIITVRQIVSVFATLFITHFLNKFGAKATACFALLCQVIAFIVFGIGGSLIPYYIGAALNGISYSIGGTILVSIFITNWFISRRALALGICGASSGLASFISSPILTRIIESKGLSFAFYIEAAFIAIVLVLAFAVLREKPENIGLAPFDNGIPDADTKKTYATSVNKRVSSIIICSMLILGFCSNVGTVQPSSMYTSVGFSSTQVASFLSILGISLMLSKMIFGQVTDKKGGYFSTILFSLILLIGGILACLANLKNTAIAYASMICMGIGFPVSTVGLSVAAMNFSTKENFAKCMKQYQFIYMLGGTFGSITPGIIVDACGSYIPAMVLFCIFLIGYIILSIIAYNSKVNTQ